MAVENTLWTERYRPQKLQDIILPERIKSQFAKMIEQGSIPNLLLAGSAGTGKTTVAKALAKELGCDFYMINGSEETGIDVLRTKVKSYAATVSVMSDAEHKIMCIDEADYLAPNSTQPAMRGLMEEFHNNCRFILTCNYKNRIIPALHSRCTVIDFNITNAEKTRMMAEFMKRVMGILKENQVEFDPKVLAAFIQSMFPDFRRTLNELQRYATSGVIDSGILKSTGDEAITDIMEFLRAKDFRAMRTWVDGNPNIDVSSLFEKLYTKAGEFIVPQSQPELILILDEYQTKALSALNPKINIAAALVQLMAALEFKK